MTTTHAAPAAPSGGFEPLRPYGPAAGEPEPRASLEARLIAANERAALLAQQLAETTERCDRLEHQVADLEDRNRELAAEAEDARDHADEHALDADHERLATYTDRPHFVNAFASVGHGKGWSR
ncbi:hypothetical protein ACW9HQ_38100 [Nocardia gipuzkoensis]